MLSQRGVQDRSSLCFLEERYRTDRLCASSKRGTGQIIFVLSQRGEQDRSSLCFLKEGYRTGRLCAFSKRGTGQAVFFYFLSKGWLVSYTEIPIISPRTPNLNHLTQTETYTDNLLIFLLQLAFLHLPSGMAFSLSIRRELS